MSGEVHSRAIPERGDCRADPVQWHSHCRFAHNRVGAIVEFQPIQNIAKTAVNDGQAAAIVAACETVSLDVDRAVADKGHGEGWAVGPDAVGQGHGDRVFGDGRVIGDGHPARARGVRQSADWAGPELPRGGGRSEEEEGKSGAHEKDVAGRAPGASNARWVKSGADPVRWGFAR